MEEHIHMTKKKRQTEVVNKIGSLFARNRNKFLQSEPGGSHDDLRVRHSTRDPYFYLDFLLSEGDTSGGKRHG